MSDARRAAPAPALQQQCKATVAKCDLDHTFGVFAERSMRLLRAHGSFLAEIAVACIGSGILACVIAANQQWFDRHFLPGFFVSRAKYVQMESYARVAAAALGVALVLVVRRPIAR